MRSSLGAVVVLFIACGSVRAQTFAPAESLGVRFGTEQTQELQVGVVVTAQGGPCSGIVGTTPVPIDWPEQQVKILKEDVSSEVRGVTYRMIGGTARQMVVTIPQIASGQEARAVITFAVTKKVILPPADTSLFVLPEVKKVKGDVRIYLGPSPYIESTHASIRALAKETIADKATAWEKVEALYEVTRSKVEYTNGPLKGAVQALKDGTGDCEELSSLFIALCRASGVPARIVWVPGHCYPEFYLEDKEGKGYWFPCQAAGNREFGGINEMRPILQKGDNFQVPERKERLRYISEYLTGKGGQPRCQFICDVGGSG